MAGEYTVKYILGEAVGSRPVGTSFEDALEAAYGLKKAGADKVLIYLSIGRKEALMDGAGVWY